jgi:hypothetical protein
VPAGSCTYSRPAPFSLATLSLRSPQQHQQRIDDYRNRLGRTGDPQDRYGDSSGQAEHRNLLPGHAASVVAVVLARHVGTTGSHNREVGDGAISCSPGPGEALEPSLWLQGCCKVLIDATDLRGYGGLEARCEGCQGSQRQRADLQGCSDLRGVERSPCRWQGRGKVVTRALGLGGCHRAGATARRSAPSSRRPSAP